MKSERSQVRGVTVRGQRRQRQRGVALLLVLWIFMTLGVLALDFGKYMRDDAMAAVNMVEETRGYYLAVAGMNRAIYELMDAQERQPNSVGFLRQDFFDPAPDLEGETTTLSIPPDGAWHDGTFGEGAYRVRITDEGGRIAINSASRSLLTIVFRNLLVGGGPTQSMNRREQQEIQGLVSSILDWRDTDGLVREGGAENEYYLALRPPYRAKNGFFDFPEELLFVRGMTADLIYGAEGRPALRDIFSVFSRSRKVNLRSVTAPVLQALLGLDAETAAEIVTERSTDAAAYLDRVQAEIATVNPGLRNVLADAGPQVVTIEGRADVQQERNQSRVAAVVDLEESQMEGPRVLRWYDRAPWTMDAPPAGGAEAGA